jgi:hypothetical protein
MTEEDYNVVETMEKYGGSFVVALANTARHADIHNLNKIKSTFSDYWEQYKEMSKK